MERWRQSPRLQLELFLLIRFDLFAPIAEGVGLPGQNNSTRSLLRAAHCSQGQARPPLLAIESQPLSHSSFYYWSQKQVPISGLNIETSAIMDGKLHGQKPTHFINNRHTLLIKTELLPPNEITPPSHSWPDSSVYQHPSHGHMRCDKPTTVKERCEG